MSHDNLKGLGVCSVLLEQHVTTYAWEEDLRCGQEGSCFPENDRCEFHSLAKILDSDLLLTHFSSPGVPFLTYLQSSHLMLYLLPFHPLSICSFWGEKPFKSQFESSHQNNLSVMFPEQGIMEVRRLCQDK